MTGVNHLFFSEIRNFIQYAIIMMEADVLATKILWIALDLKFCAYFNVNKEAGSFTM